MKLRFNPILVLICCEYYDVLSIGISMRNSSLQTLETDGQKECMLKTQCGPNQRCVEGICQCMPNFANKSGVCNQFQCTKDDMCGREYDPNRVCRDGSCVCPDNQREDPYGEVCVENCSSSEDCKDTNSYCYYGQCICFPGHRRDVYGICQSAKCDDSSDCFYRLHDFHTHCVKGECVCNNEYTTDSSNDMCSHKLTPWVWAWVFFVIPLIIIALVIWYNRRNKSV